MSGGFTKLFSSIVTSTIWQEDDKTRIVWITLLALADAQGRVEGSVPGLAHVAHVGLGECEHALERLSSPDPYSRTKDFEGRRIEAIDGGWQILNYAKYRERRDPEARREYQRQWDRDHRPSGHKRKQSSSPTRSDRVRPRPTQAEAEAEADTSSAAQRSARRPFVPPTVDEVQVYIEANPELANVDAGAFVRFFEDGDPPWTDSRGKPVKNWKQKLRTWSNHNEHAAAKPQFDRDHDRHSDFGDTITV